MPSFDAIDWEESGATLQIDGINYEVFVSPYSLGCNVIADIVAVSSIQELEKCEAKSKIIFLHGSIAKEQLMPKNFVFYNPAEHQKIITFLEKSEAQAIICATGRNAGLAGGVYPFPLIEDGDFDIPSVYMIEEVGEKIIANNGKKASLKSISKRIPAKAYNVLARKGNNDSKRIVITAHIDAKKGTPGALDNASGVIVLLLLADLLKNYTNNVLIEIVALNGEDYYGVPGQMNYIAANKNRFGNITLNINIDGAGYKEGKSAISFYNVPISIKEKIYSIMEKYDGIKEGGQWPQSDHSIFVQYGRPAIAVSSEWFIENINSQKITHTEKDVPSLIDCSKLVEISQALAKIVFEISDL
ncbi:MAG: M28 family peptidase [Ignavibacteria bacterium]|jgi:aminopeptidase YwaD